MKAFWDGPVWVENKFPKIKYAMDYPEFYNIPYGTGKAWETFVIPGAYSVDKYYRLQNKWAWFEDEQLTEEEKEYGRKRVQDKNEKCDLILSHTCPCIYIPTHLFLSCVDQSTVDNSMERYLGEIEYTMDYKAWIWGHYHDEIDYPRTHGRRRALIYNCPIDLEKFMTEKGWESL